MPKISQYSSTTPVSGDQFVLARAGSNFRTDFSILNKVVQVVHTQTGAVATGTTVIPADDTIPQNTEGDQYMTRAITPANASNKLLIEVVAYVAFSVAAYVAGALFQDSVAGALASGITTIAGANYNNPLLIIHEMTAGTTSAITFKFRAGGNVAGTLTFNGANGARLFGGVMASSIRITEFTP